MKSFFSTLTSNVARTAETMAARKFRTAMTIAAMGCGALTVGVISELK